MDKLLWVLSGLAFAVVGVALVLAFTGEIGAFVWAMADWINNLTH